MAGKKGRAGMSRRTAIRRSRELIAALDRRVPREGAAGEAGIAAESAALKREAQDRIATLEAETVPESPKDGPR